MSLRICQSECELMILIDEYCHQNWLKITANGGPYPEFNPVSFVDFIKWLDARRRQELKDEDDRQKALSIQLGGTLG